MNQAYMSAEAGTNLVYETRASTFTAHSASLAPLMFGTFLISCALFATFLWRTKIRQHNMLQLAAC